MKFTIKQTREELKTIELPSYFKFNGFKDLYFMVKGNQSAILVADYNMEEPLSLYPRIEGVNLNHYILHFTEGIEPISETEFKTAFLRVSLELEKLAN